MLTAALPIALALSSAPAAAQDPPPPLIVGTHEVAPFVIREADGTWRGISIDLWDQVADRLGLAYEIRDLEVPALVTNEGGAVDVAVSLNISPKSEAAYDMTHAFLSTGLAIAARPQSASFLAALGRVLTPSFLALFGGVAVLLVGAGSMMWLVERRQNAEALGGASGWVSAVLWAVETVVGYGDPIHQTRTGRVLALAWAAFGVVVVSTITAQLSSQLTIAGLETAVSGPEDLPRVEVGTVEPSAGWRYCERRGLACRGYPDAAAAVAGLAAGEVDAVVYEAPILRYVALQDHPDEVVVLPGTFDNHGYGFGLRTGSTLREDVNLALLEITTSDGFRKLLTDYLGPAAD